MQVELTDKGLEIFPGSKTEAYALNAYLEVTPELRNLIHFEGKKAADLPLFPEKTEAKKEDVKKEEPKKSTTKTSAKKAVKDTVVEPAPIDVGPTPDVDIFEEVESPFAEEPAKEEKVTREQLVEAVKLFAAKKSPDEAKKALLPFVKISDIPEAKYGEVYKRFSV